MELLQNANEWLLATFGELGPLYAIGALGLLLVLLTLPSFLKRKADPMDKLKGTGGNRTAKVDDGKGAKLRTKDHKAEKLDKFATFLEPQTAEEMGAARLRMMQAGYRGKNAVRMYHFIQFSLGILAEAALSYIGLGAQPPTPSWGRMLAEAQTMIYTAPRLAMWPGLAIVAMVLGLNLMGDGLRDLLDPRVRRERA